MCTYFHSSKIMHLNALWYVIRTKYIKYIWKKNQAVNVCHWQWKCIHTVLMLLPNMILRIQKTLETCVFEVVKFLVRGCLTQAV